MPASGKLTERVTISRGIETDDNQGGVAVSWSDVVTVWSEFVPLPSREAVKEGRLGSPALYSVTLRWPVDVKANDRMHWGNGNMTLLVVDCVPPPARSHFITVIAEEII